MNEFLEVLSKHFDKLNALMWATLRARLALPDGTRMQFPPSVKKGNHVDAPHGIVAHLTRECGGNVHDRHAVDVTSGPFEKETYRGQSQLGGIDNHSDCAAKDSADLDTESSFTSTFRSNEEIPARQTTGCSAISRRA
jgi:hypothetical protein